MAFLNAMLKEEVKKVFEPRYKRQLADTEIVEIAENLTGMIEAIFKFKLKPKYEKSI